MASAAAHGSVSGGFLYSLRVHRGASIKGSTSVFLEVAVDAKIGTVAELAAALVAQHPALAADGPLQLWLHLKGLAPAPLPEHAQLATLDLARRCAEPQAAQQRGPAAKPAAWLLVNRRPQPPPAAKPASGQGATATTAVAPQPPPPRTAALGADEPETPRNIELDFDGLDLAGDDAAPASAPAALPAGGGVQHGKQRRSGVPPYGGLA